MSKRPATEAHSSDGQAFAKVKSNGARREQDSSNPPEMGEFEDDWEDEIESDEEAVDGKGAEENEDEGMEVDDVMPPIEETDEQPAQAEVFIPGKHRLGKDEILEADDSVYLMRHSLNVNWPCLSFDVLRDNLGDGRERYPATAYIVAGTQADVASNNELAVYKMSSLHRTQTDGDESDNDDDEENDNDLDEDPVLEYRTIKHIGGINRVRAQPLPLSTSLPPVSQPYHVATWAETGKVHIWDVRPLIESLDVPGYVADKSRTSKPVHTINSHGRAEGFALDWAADHANPSALRLLSGDITSKIYHTVTTQTGFSTSSQPFSSHTSSIEDLQWSPGEPSVFASCSADRSIRLWDVRVKNRKSVVTISPAHESDVNVISWNKTATANYLLLSGGDEGGIKVWDFRNLNGSSTPSPVASFSWHKAPITSIEWHPTEDTNFAASGADNQVTLWDLSVEPDEDEAGVPMDENALENLPPQLLFVHQGQKDVKEVHWHPQIPGAVISTAYDGFNIFKTITM